MQEAREGGDLRIWTYDPTNQLISEQRTEGESWSALTVDQWGGMGVNDWGLLPALSAAGPITTYVYDPVGNRLVLNVDGELTTSTYNAANRLVTAEDISGITTYTFDANGNQRTVEMPTNDITTYSWTYENQLAQLEEPDDVITTYIYAPTNRRGEELRLSKETETGLVQFLWDDQNLIQELDDTGTVEAEYTLNPQPYGDLVSQRRDHDSTFYHYDALGSTQSLTDQTGTVENEYTYSAFGKELSSSGSVDNPFTWVGELGYYKEEDGRYTLRKREYEEAIARFLSEDPIRFDAGDENLYRYVGNSPSNAVDPSGLDSLFSYSMDSKEVYWNVERVGYLSNESCDKIHIGTKITSTKVLLDAGFGHCIVDLETLRSLIESPFGTGLCNVNEERRYRIIQDRLTHQICGSALPDLGPPASSACGTFLEDLGTGTKAVINGTATAIVRTATLGFCDREIELWAISKEDRADGYDTAVAIATVSGEVLIAAVTGGAASILEKGGQVARTAGGALVVFDAAGNIVGVVRGTIDAVSNGLTLQNGIQIVGSGFGLGINSVSLRGKAFDIKEPGTTCPNTSQTCPIPPRTPPVVPTPDDLPKGTMPPLNNNGVGDPYGTPKTRTPSNNTSSAGSNLVKYPLSAADRDRIEKIRSSLGIGNKRNIAFAEGYVGGKSIGEIIGISGESTPGVLMPLQRTFATGVDQFDRAFDAEVFVLEKLSQKIKPTDCGTIKLVSERPFCASCSSVITQFQRMFPNINLILVD